MANLGETKAQIEKRWGSPIEISGYPDERIYTYQTGQFRVRVGFLDGFSQCELYRHLGQRDEITPLGETEIQELLRRNSSGQKWEIDGDVYRLPDRSASAFLNQNSGKNRSLYLTTAQYSARLTDPQRYVRTGKTRTISGVVNL